MILCKVYFTFDSSFNHQSNLFHMNQSFLFPHRFKPVGWVMLALGIFGLFTLNSAFAENFVFPMFAIADGGTLGNNFMTEEGYFTIVRTPICDELTLTFLIAGSLLVGFSRCKVEDELIAKTRYESLVWAVYFNFGLLLLATLFIYGTYYLNVVLHNIFSLLIFFIIRFHLKLYQLQKAVGDDE